MRIHGRVSAVVAAIPQDSNVDRPVFGPATFKDVGFDTSVLFGGKAGIFFDTPVLVGNVGPGVGGLSGTGEPGARSLTLVGWAT